MIIRIMNRKYYIQLIQKQLFNIYYKNAAFIWKEKFNNPDIIIQTPFNIRRKIEKEFIFMSFFQLWMLLLALALCSKEENGQWFTIATSSTAPSRKWICILNNHGKHLCSTSSSIYFSYSMKDECRWKITRVSRGYLLKNSHGKYLAGNQHKQVPRLFSYGHSVCLWRIANYGSHFGKIQWLMQNIHYQTYLGRNGRGPFLKYNFRDPRDQLWGLRSYKDVDSARLRNTYPLKTCIKGASGSYITEASNGKGIEGSKVCDKKAQWYLIRNSYGHYLIQNSYSKKYLVINREVFYKVDPRSDNGLWSIYSYGKGYLIKSKYHYFVTMWQNGWPSNSEKIKKEAIWTLETPKIIEKKEPLQQKKFNLALYNVPQKKYLTSFGSHFSLSKKKIDSLWVAVPVGKKAGKHYLVNFEGKYLTATSGSVSLSSKKSNQGLWKIEEIDKKYWRLEHIQTGKYFVFSNSRFSLSPKSESEWMVYNFNYTDDLSKKISKPLSFYNPKSKAYLNINSENPQMSSEASPLKIKKDGFFYFIDYKGKFLNFDTNSFVPNLSKVKNSGSLYKIHKESNGFYVFILYGHLGAKLGVTSNGHLKALYSSGSDIQWQLSTYK